MKKLHITIMALLVTLCGIGAPPKEKVEFKNNEKDKKVEVFIGGKFFTAYIYPDNMEKQSLYPIVSASGKTITRGYPLNPRSFERTDHPHHVGLWFNFGDVNGLDFWNNSYAIPANKKSLYGWVRTDRIIETKSGSTGILAYHANWVNQKKQVLMERVEDRSLRS